MANNPTTRQTPTLRQRIGNWIAGTKSVLTSTSDEGWTPIAGATGSFLGRFRGSGVDWEERAGTLWEHPSTALALSFLFDKVVEPRINIQRSVTAVEFETISRENADPTLRAVFDLWDTPNPEYDGATLRQITALSYRLAGNAYWVKVRPNRYAPPTELWYIPHWQMAPLEPDDGGPTRQYKRIVAGRNGRSSTTIYSREDVIHFKRGIDPKNPRIGLNLFAGILRELVTDSDIATYSAALLKNFGVSAGLVSSADPDAPLDSDARDRLKSMMDIRTTGDQAGSWIVSSLPLKIDQIGASPHEMDIASLGTRPEARVLAAFGFNAMAIGLPSDDKKYANYQEARAAAWEDGIIPLLADMAEALTSQFLPEFDPTGTLRLVFNYGHIRDLQPDEDKKSTRHVAEWKAGVRLLSETRSALGLADPIAIDGFSWQLAPAHAGGSASSAPSDNASTSNTG